MLSRSSSMAISYCLALVLATVAVADDQYGLVRSQPAVSCRDIYQKNPTSHGKSGYYIVTADGKPSFVYCDMELECGGEKGWLKVTDINVAKGNSCPHGWKKITSPVAACRAPSDNAGCYSAQFSTHQVAYSRVCGMVIGYQKGSTDGFHRIAYPSRSIDGPYVDGVSITYGTPRKHIWSYAIGINELGGALSCPCARSIGSLPPPFVHENYYCESGSYNTPSSWSLYLTDDPVWDGKGCPNENSCCSEPNMPWFYRQIPLTSSKNLEARICHDQPFSDEGVLVKEIKLFIQ